MRNLHFIALSLFIGLSQSRTLTVNSNRHVLQGGNLKDGCDGTMCPGGCCPEKNWQCCPDGLYCAETMDDCPKRNLKKMLVGMAANKINGCDGTMCPGGCCPEKNWQCCPDGVYCAETKDDCPIVVMMEKLIKMAAKKANDCDGTMCPGGCCPEKNWQCCPDGVYCAETKDDCPKLSATRTLIGLAALQDDCDGVMCPGGCCTEPGWQCCPDGVFCAETVADCPIKRTALARLAANKPEEPRLPLLGEELWDCDGIRCLGGCCPHKDWICCSNNFYCAEFEENCIEL